MSSLIVRNVSRGSKSRASSQGDESQLLSNGADEEGSINVATRRNFASRIQRAASRATSILTPKFPSRRRKKNLPKKTKLGLKNRDGFEKKILRDNRTRSMAVFSSGFRRLRSTTSKMFSGIGFDSKTEGKSSGSGQTKLTGEVKEAYKELLRYKQMDDLDEATSVLDILREHSKVREIQTRGLSFLYPFALQEPEALMSKGALAIARAAFENFPKSMRVLEPACILLWHLATEEKNLGILNEANAHELVLKVLKAFDKRERPFNRINSKMNSVSGGGFGALLQVTIGAIKAMIISEDIKAKIVEADGIPMVSRAFIFICGETPNDPDPQETCITCIQNFCNGPNLDEYCNQAFEHLAPEMVIRSMVKFPLDNKIQTAGCAAIWNLSLAIKSEQEYEEDEEDDEENKEEPLPSSNSESNHKTSEEVEKEDDEKEAKGDADAEIDDKKIEVKPVAKPKPKKKKKMSGLQRRKHLADVGAGTRAVAALKEWAGDSRVVARAMGGLKALIRGDDDILQTVRDLIHERESSFNKDLGVVNIYDVIYEAYNRHKDVDVDIEKFGLDLLESFDIEDNENTNREEIEQRAKKGLGILNKSLHEIRLPSPSPRAPAVDDKRVKSLENSVNGFDQGGFDLRQAFNATLERANQTDNSFDDKEKEDEDNSDLDDLGI